MTIGVTAIGAVGVADVALVSGVLANITAMTNTYSSAGPTDEMREEMKKWLLNAKDGCEHRAVLELRERGLTLEEIAIRRDTTVKSVRVWAISLDHMFAGTIPATSSAALTNSYGYRELLNHPLSEGLEQYVMARLQGLIAVNPKVSTRPLKTRAFKYRKPESK